MPCRHTGLSVAALPAVRNGCWSVVEKIPLFAQQDFAAADELVINPDAIFVVGWFAAGAGRASEQAHSRRGLKNIGAERATVDVEFDAEIARFAKPGNLIAGIEDDGFRENSNQNGAISHAESLQLTAESAKFCRNGATFVARRRARRLRVE